MLAFFLHYSYKLLPGPFDWNWNNILFLWFWRHHANAIMVINMVTIDSYLMWIIVLNVHLYPANINCIVLHWLAAPGLEREKDSGQVLGQ